MDLGFIGGFEFPGQFYDRLPNRMRSQNDISAAACRTYRNNLGDCIVQGDVNSIEAHLPKNCDILIGGFPFQNVPVNGKRKILYKQISGSSPQFETSRIHC